MLRSCCCISWFPLIWYATWPCSEKLNFDILTPRVRGWGGGGVCVLPCCYISWSHLIRYATWPCSEKVEFWLGSWGKGEGACGQNICYHIAAFLIPFNFICNMTIFWKWNFHLWPQAQGQRVGVCRNRLWFLLIWYASWQYSEKLTFDLWTPSQGSGMQAKHLLPCCCIRDSL